MAYGTANISEQLLTAHRRLRTRQRRIARRSLGRAHEPREMIDVLEIVVVRIRLTIWFCNRPGSRFSWRLGGNDHGVAHQRDLFRLESAGDSHFVEVGVGGEGQQTGVLVFLTEAA